MKVLCVSNKLTDMWNINSYRITICNSFFGLDKPALLPPNFNMVGPLIKQSDEDMMKNLQEKDPDLFEWVESAAT